MGQHYISRDGCEGEIAALVRRHNAARILLVCGRSFLASPLWASVSAACAHGGKEIICFNQFTPNPRYGDVREGVRVFRESGCGFIIAAGGGSAIDVAKCIKLFAGMPAGGDYLRCRMADTGIPLLAIPTTAGSGSEATRFAVVYVDGEKHSVEHESALPNYVLLYPDALRTLGSYQRKATVCDALAHAVESWWSVRSTPESRQWSRKAIQGILEHAPSYVWGADDCCREMLQAANYAGRAINLAKTTAAHAMSYKLAALLEIPHGHAVMLCLPEAWEYMDGHLDACTDSRGREYLCGTLEELAGCLQQGSCRDAVAYLKNLRDAWGLCLPGGAGPECARQLAGSVNAERLGNFPVRLGEGGLECLYRRILRG